MDVEQKRLRSYGLELEYAKIFAQRKRAQSKIARLLSTGMGFYVMWMWNVQCSVYRHHTRILCNCAVQRTPTKTITSDFPHSIVVCVILSGIRFSENNNCMSYSFSPRHFLPHSLASVLVHIFETVSCDCMCPPSAGVCVCVCVIVSKPIIYLLLSNNKSMCVQCT